MAIVQNRATEIGDVLWIKVEVPIVGLVALTSFIDDTDDESTSITFTKVFRYSFDGVLYTDWIELTLANLTTINITSSEAFYIEYQYRRDGTNHSVNGIAWNSTTIGGSSTLTNNNTIFSKSTFAQFFSNNDINVLGWAINVLQKVYQQGLVAAYISRDGTITNDSDFIQFWKSICVFWAYLVYFSRIFEAFKNNEYLADLYLNNFGNYTCGDEPIDQLVYIIANQFRTRAKRGTYKMYEVGSGDINDSDSLDNLQNTVDGELLKLICWTANDFFKLGLSASQLTGWNIGNCSPMYRSNTRRIDLNLGYEDSADVTNLSSYPRTNSQYISIFGEDGPDAGSDYDSTSDYESDSYTPYVDDKRVIKIASVPVGMISGIGNTSFSQALLIDPSLDFEITFYVKQPVRSPNFTFGVKCFDIGGNLINTLSVVDSSIQTNFFERKRLNRNDKYYFVRGIIFNSSQALMSAADAKLNIGFGNHLKFPTNAFKIQPYIVLDNWSDDDDSTASLSELDIDKLYLWDIKVTPAALPYSRGFLNSKSFMDVYLKSRTTKYSHDQLNSIMRYFFVPYGVDFRNTFI